MDPAVGYKSASHYRELYEEHKARADRAEQERDQQQARLAELESGIDSQMRAIGGLQALIHDLRDAVEHAAAIGSRTEACLYAEKVISITPNQSLAAHDARVLRELVDEYVERVALNGSESERAYAITYGSINVRDIAKKAQRIESQSKQATP